MCKFDIIEGDITELDFDAIVNPANVSLLGGFGLDGLIHKKAGPELLEECKTLGGTVTGIPKITKAYNLKCKYIIHTVGPIYVGGKHNEEKLLYQAYYNSLVLGKDYNIKTIAFPVISSGIYEYPFEEALKIGIKAIKDFIKNNDYKYKKIIIVVFNREINKSKYL